ncbi:MAG: sugar phosphate nucleotidyltransferase [Rickettsiales bacterium]|nr:sugar phosphate nucleotidyltransferase [Rickettsiales bacterium]
MQAIILAGGMGTRLKGVVDDVPKPLASVSDRPFLAWLLEYMASQGVTEAMLCLHHKAEQIHDYLGDTAHGIQLRYSMEQTPLGTGGALRQAMQQLKPTQPVFALNGDSLVQLDYRQMMAHHKHQARPLTLAAQFVDDCSRYSELTKHYAYISEYKVLGRREPGLASVGFYVLSPDLFEGHELPGVFSFERDFLAPHTPTLKPAMYDEVRYFIDIGVPQDYARANIEIPRLTLE